MKKEDFKIQIIETETSEGKVYTAWIEGISGIVCQCNSIEEIPKELASLFETLLRYGMQIKNYEITPFNK